MNKKISAIWKQLILRNRIYHSPTSALKVGSALLKVFCWGYTPKTLGPQLFRPIFPAPTSNPHTAFTGELLLDQEESTWWTCKKSEQGQKNLISTTTAKWKKQSWSVPSRKGKAISHAFRVPPIFATRPHVAGALNVWQPSWPADHLVISGLQIAPQAGYEQSVCKFWPAYWWTLNM